MWSAGGRAGLLGPRLLGLPLWPLLGLLVLLGLPGRGAAKTGAGFVTCGSVLKLFNTHHRVRLHSHDIKYGSGARRDPGGLAVGRRGVCVPQKAGGGVGVHDAGAGA